MQDDAAWLHAQAVMLFVLDGQGRITRENDPPRSTPPRLWLAGGRRSNRVQLAARSSRAGVAEILALVATEPPLGLGEGVPIHLARYRALLAQRPLPAVQCNVIHAVVSQPPNPSGSTMLCSDTAHGAALCAAWRKHGVPTPWRQLGFSSVEDLWPPWCAVAHQGEIAAIAFAARLSAWGAELGLVTATHLRKRGFATAAVKGWSALPSLKGRRLFYTADTANEASLRVIARLRLPRLGRSVRLV